MFTARELRAILFNVQDQKMTIEELRKVLFDAENQDKEITLFDIAKITASAKPPIKLVSSGGQWVEEDE